MKNIIVSAGHGDRDPGAVSGSLIEHCHAYVIAWHLRSELEEKGYAVEFISCFQPLALKIRQVNALHQETAIDLAVEVHFNSAESPDAHGTEVLHYSPKTKSLAADISESLSAAIGTRDRGPKHRTDLGWLKQTVPRALIVEVCFISSAIDAGKIIAPDFHLSAAKGIAGGIHG